MRATGLIIVLAAALAAVSLVTPASAAPRDVNTWGSASFTSSESGGNWTYAWSVTWAPVPDQTDGLTWYLTGLEYHPDGTAPPIVNTLAKPNSDWTDMINPNDGWLGWYLTDFSDLATSGLGPGTYTDVWSGTFTPTNGINPANYHLQFTAYNPASGKYITEQSSLTARENTVPEPATAGLVMLGLAGLGVLRRRRA